MSRPKLHRKNSLHVRSSFFGFVPSSSGFSCRRRVCSPFFLRDTDQVVTGHTPHWHLFGLVPFPFFCPRRMCVIAHFGRASLLFWCFLGVPFWALRVFGVFGFSRNFVAPWGLSSLAPSEAPFSLSRTRHARRQGCLRRFSFVVFVFPLLSCLRLHTLERPAP